MLSDRKHTEQSDSVIGLLNSSFEIDFECLAAEDASSDIYVTVQMILLGVDFSEGSIFSGSCSSLNVFFLNLILQNI